MGEAADILTWDHEVVLDHELAKEGVIVKQFRQLFDLLDVHQNGYLSVQELKRGFEDDHIQAFFQYLNIDTTMNSQFFHLLDVDSSGTVTEDEFIKGCMRLQNGAKALEIQSLIWDCKLLSHKVDDLGNCLETICSHLGVSYERPRTGTIGDIRR